ncbi:hypothetical protein HN858_05630 [Candidatus Falkowbacteria bacterium]|jgi:hypothetical protein|nr:hypothetical protein [Candidatus Falkowbacteria bacterium]MBT5502895.1 hypothetical protein [Candidatus Falkowbacteria bacterium]MBT6573741.1 hypothetical protein [Candidatus Falkowbacteria bacterium]MBT7349117.1 hypothetical protein [Candidatus Falkowbacteria bacterium]MBT7500068.1 hypothetical protein [Candidatus Falkowbacteria bacterium]
MEKESSQYDDRVLLLLRVLFKEVVKGEKKGEFPLFTPTRLMISSVGRVKFEVMHRVGDVSVSLQSLGVSVYHLLTGESEYNKESFRFDGYSTRPIKSIHWPVLKFMLEGSAQDLQYIKKRLSKFELWRADVSDRWNQLRNRIHNRTEEKITLVNGNVKVEYMGIVRSWGGKLEFVGDLVFIAVFGSAFLLSQVCAIGALVLFSVHAYQFFPIPLMAMIWIVYITGFLFLHYTSYGLRTKMHWQWRHLSITVISFILTSLVLFSAGRCFDWTHVNKDSNGQEKSFVVIDRQLNRPIARLSQDETDTFMQWTEASVSPLYYSIEPGLRLNGEFKMHFRLNAVLPNEQNFIFESRIQYVLDINDDIEFHVALDKWARTDVLQSSIDQHVTGLSFDVEKELRQSKVLHDPTLLTFERESIVKKIFVEKFKQNPIAPEVMIQLE